MANNANIANTRIVAAETMDAPYWNDFDEDKNFHQILFRPSYAVQAREMNQLQTILQHQIERLGNHIFKNGSLVLGGQMSLSSANYINVESQYANSDIDVLSFVGKTITWTANSRARALVLDAREATDNDPPMLAIKYLSGKKFGNQDTIKVSGEELFANLQSTNSNGVCSVASINPGIFFINGYFVKNPTQITIVQKYSPRANAKIGLEFDDFIVDEDTDSSLLDPAQGASNYQAPGATRYVIQLNLTTRPLDSDDVSLEDMDEQKFIELMRVESGIVKSQVIYPSYSSLGDQLARQLYEHSGSFTITPFNISFKDHPSDDTKVMAILSPGKAYVKGYEYETISETNIEIDRARETSNVQNYDLVCQIGNYFIGQNLTGVFDTTSFATADIHCVPYQYVNLVSSSAYTTTKIGTARVRDMIYFGATDTSDDNTRLYKTSITKSEFTKIQTNANTTAALTANSVGLWNGNSILSSNNNAYIGATLRLSVSGTVYEYVVSAYDGSTKVVSLNKNFAANPASTSNAVLAFDFAEAESLMISSYTSGSPSERANVNINPQNSKTIANNSYLSETNYDCLVFKFPQEFIAYGTMNDRDYEYRKKFSATFSSNSASISVTSPDEAFSGNTSGATSTTLRENYLVIGSSNQVVPLSAVTVDGSGGATLTATNYNGSATIFAKVFLNSGNNTNPKRKALVTGNTTHLVRHAANGTFLQDISATKTMNTSVYLVAGQVTVQNPQRVPHAPISLYVSDVKSISKIYDLNGASIPAVGASLASYSDVTRYFALNTGQRDSYYDHASLALRPNFGAGPKGPLVVCFNYYDHQQGSTNDGLGYFSVDSYPNANTTAGYADIPTFLRSDGTVMELRDCIDFRPKRINAFNTSPGFTLSGIRIPLMNQAFESDYDYYLPRRDYLVMTTDLSNPFQVIVGKSELYPQEPRNIDQAMILYKLFIPAYTKNTADVYSEFIENKRYTERDIGLLEKRIVTLEYYQTLSLLEKASSDLLIVDEFGLERTKYGILVDTFLGHGIGDVTNPDYKCGMNKVVGALRPARRRHALQMFNSSNTNIRITGDKAILDYSTTRFITQPYSSKSENVQPYALAEFIGSLVLDPDKITWIDTKNVPNVIVNIQGVNDDFVGAIDGTLGGTEDNDAFENSDAIEIPQFGLPIDRTDEQATQTPPSKTTINKYVSGGLTIPGSNGRN